MSGFRTPDRRTRRRTTATALVLLPAAALALACGDGRKPADDKLPDDLRHDLELASTSGIQLAGANKGGAPLQVVSAEEESPKSTPVKATRSATPKASGHRRHTPTPKPKEPAPEPIADEVAAAAPAADAGSKPEQPAPAAEPQAPVPSTDPSPVPFPGGSGTVDQGRRGDDIGTAIGAVLGVIIRGAMVGGVDKCDERPRHGRGASEMPGGMTMPMPNMPAGVGAQLPGNPYDDRPFPPMRRGGRVRF